MTRFLAIIWLTAGLIAASGATVARVQIPDKARLSPADIAAMPHTGSGAGTSGVNGIRTRILSGDPTKPGPYTIALEVPANTRIAAHRHRDPRSAVVVGGTWYFGFGSKASDGAARPLGPGSFYLEPADVPHFARTGDEPVTVYITGNGPTDTRYIVAAEAPAGR